MEVFGLSDHFVYAAFRDFSAFEIDFGLFVYAEAFKAVGLKDVADCDGFFYIFLEWGRAFAFVGFPEEWIAVIAFLDLVEHGFLIIQDLGHKIKSAVQVIDLDLILQKGTKNLYEFRIFTENIVNFHKRRIIRF